MSIYVLILVLKVGYGTTSVVIDMPDKSTCQLAAISAEHELQRSFASMLNGAGLVSLVEAACIRRVYDGK